MCVPASGDSERTLNSLPAAATSSIDLASAGCEITWSELEIKNVLKACIGPVIIYINLIVLFLIELIDVLGSARSPWGGRG